MDNIVIRGEAFSPCEKGDISRIVKLDTSSYGFNMYLLEVASTINIIVIENYGGGLVFVVLDSTGANGVGAFTFMYEDECRLREKIRHDTRFYYFDIPSGTIYVRKQQFDRFLDMLVECRGENSG